MLNTTNATAVARYNSIQTLGRPVEATHWSEAIEQARLDWRVKKLQHVSPIDGSPVGSYGIYREDNGSFLGQVGNQYTAIQNIDQFKFVDQLVENIDGAHYVAAGSVEGGQKVFCCVKLTSFEIGADGDEHSAFLLVSDWKNSRGSLAAQISILRKVCENGMHAWIADKAMKFRHTPNVADRMLLTSSVAMIGDALQTTRHKLDTLASKEINSKRTVESILDRLFPASQAELDGRVNNVRAETQTKILELFEDNDNNAFPSEARTPFALLNSVTQFVDHFQATKATAARGSLSEVERRANSALFGRGAEFKQRALDIILEETASLPSTRRVYSTPSVIDVVAVVNDVNLN